MDITIELIGKLTQAPATTNGDLPIALLEASRRDQYQKLTGTLLSIWERDGNDIGPARAHELQLHRNRIARYERLWAQIQEMVSRVELIKGLQIAAHYPEGLVRQFSDLDIVAERRVDLWRLAAWLVEEGWAPGFLTLLKDGPDIHTYLSVEGRTEDPFMLQPDAVEISTFAVGGDLWGVPLRPILPCGKCPPIKNLLLILNELIEEPYRKTFGGRDLLDGILMLEKIVPDDLPNLWESLDRLDMWPEWMRMAERLTNLDLLPEEVASSQRDRIKLVNAHLKRWSRGVKGLSPPTKGLLSWSQRRFMRGRPSPASRWVSGKLQQRLSLEDAFAFGLPLFGARIDDRRSQADLELRKIGNALVGVTPIGTFSFTFGEVLPEEPLVDSFLAT